MPTEIIETRTTSVPVANNTTYLLPAGSWVVSQSTGFTTPGTGADQAHVIVGGSVLADSNAFLFTDSSPSGEVAITVLDTGVVATTATTAAAMSADLNTLINHGSISTLGSVVASLSGGSVGLIENHGQMSYLGQPRSFGQVILAETIVDVSIVNTGSITTVYTAPAIQDQTFIGTFSLRNTGEISAQATAIEVERVAADVWNSGVINGEVTFGLGAVVLNNSGAVLGDVTLSTQADRAELRDAGFVQGVLSGRNGNDTLIGGEAADRIAGNEDDDLIKGGGGDDSLDGGTGRDTLRGQGGDDQIETGGWTDIAYGGAGDDVMTSTAGNDTLLGGTGDDTITGGSGDNTLKGGTGDDVLSGNDGFDQISGGAGDDDIKGGGFGDTLAGGRGDDTLAGGSGNDRLKGGQGNDQLTGDSGADRFVFAPDWDVDRITDFVDGVDRLDLSAFNLANFADLTSSYSVEARSGAVLIDFGDGDMLFVEGIGIASFSGADIIF